LNHSGFLLGPTVSASVTCRSFKTSDTPDTFNQSCSDNSSSGTQRAAQLIALNKTAFNGLYRLNGKGEFNVPWGKYQNPTICDSSNLQNVSDVLRKPEVTVKACDYKEVLLENAKEGDFIYLDPPYNPASATAYFTGYTTNGFSIKADTNNIFEPAM
jgi:DNA adenine methylase